MHTLILTLVTTLLGQMSGTPESHEHDRAAISPPALTQAVAQTGRIEGHIVVNRRPARRQARQYQGTTAARPPQGLPTLVYLKGAIPGSALSRNMPSMAQQDTTFTPGFLAVALGGEVTFPNQDPFFHNVFSYSPAARFDLGRYPQGEAKEVVFDTPGVVKVFCEVHESMRSLILVTENRFYAEAAVDGSFVLEGVPAGIWTIVGWDADHGVSEETVTVTDGGVTRVELSIG